MNRLPIIQRVEQDIQTYGIIEQGDRICVGLSGGADSVCLLFLLLDLKQKYGLSLSAVHVHHGLRGAAADADEAFVRDLCARLDVLLTVCRADVRAEARKRGCSEEEAGRLVRYRAFEEAAAGGKIATAHHADDNCETILFNILRGTGLTGLTGIPQKSGQVIRPLLHVDRAQIEDYLRDRGESWCTDETNASGAYTRNRIRNELLPWLEREINPGVRMHLRNLAERAEEVQQWVLAQATSWLTAHVEPGEEAVLLPVGEYGALPAPVRKQVLFLVLERLAGQKRDITARQLDALDALPGKHVGAVVSLPYALQGRREYESIRLGKAPRICAEDYVCRFRLCAWKEEEIPTSPYTKWFDYDTIADSLVWRTRKSGDRIAIGGGKTKALGRLLIDEKIHAE